MQHPAAEWGWEIALDADIVRALISVQFPSLAVETVAYLHEGWDNTAYLVNGRWIFRFPKRQSRKIWLESELQVLEWLSGQRLPVEVPAPVYVGEPSSLYPCGFMGYEKIDGIQGDQIDVSVVNRIESARRLGELLTIMHAFDAQEAESRGVLAFEWPLRDELAETAAMYDSVYPTLPEALKPLCRPYLEGSCEIPDVSRPRRCLVHGDLEDEHLLLGERGCVTGIIDWGDCGISDPATDFRGLYAWLGEGFVRDVLAHYRHGIDAWFLEQIAFRARCNALTTYGHSLLGHATCGANRLQMVLTAFGINAPAPDDDRIDRSGSDSRLCVDGW